MISEDIKDIGGQYKYGFKDEKGVWKYYLQYIGYFFLFITLGLGLYWLLHSIAMDNILTWIMMGILVTIGINLIFIILFGRTEKFRYFYDKIQKLVLSKIRHKVQRT